MNFPIEIGYGAIKVSLHLLLELAGYSLGFRYFLFLRKKQSDQISDQNRLVVLIGATAGAFLFSRIIGSLEGPTGWVTASNKFLYFFRCKTIVGGLLGGLFGVELSKLIVGEKSSSGDLFVFPILFAMIIGRVGCFSQGVYEPTYGVESKSIFAMDLGDGLLRHPTALYEVFFLLILFLALRLIQQQSNLKNGVLFKLFLINYLLWRLVIEEWKPNVEILLGISAIQMTCILGLIYYSKTITLLLINRKRLQNADWTE